VVSVFAALTGLWDAWRSSGAGTQARRTINTHATIMIAVTVLVLADVAWRLNGHHTQAVTPVGIAVLSVVIALLVSVGATFGGSLVYDYGFNVETAGDRPEPTPRRSGHQRRRHGLLAYCRTSVPLPKVRTDSSVNSVRRNSEANIGMPEPSTTG
jgi:hypothetical protein